LSFSKRKVETSKELLASIERDDEDLIMPGHHVQQFRYEPYRQKVSFMILRIESVLEELDEAFDGVHRKSQVYNTREFIEDLELVRDSLVQSGFGDIAQHGMLNQILVKARAFGFYMAALDVRQHSRVHEQAVAVLLERAGVTDRYLEQEEADRLAVLSAELSNPRPLQAYNADLPAPTREVLDTLIAIRDILDQEPNAVGSYIISMTHSVSDLLEVMLLAKEVGLWKVEKGVVRFPLDLVPLFETIEDLENAAGLMRDIFGNDLYRKQLAARGNFQEIMLGYSDSNKDGGFWMANWALHKGQATLGHVCRDFGIDFRLFHGRGGTVGRGGGSANKAIMAMPSVSHSGRIRFTEQGEVISFRYALPDIAHRHLEQIVNAMLLASHPPADKVEHTTLEEPEGALMESLAGRSMETYRALIENPDLWTWYTYITPIAQISRLPIASRPVSRKSADEVDFDSLRAIPWGFAWTQTRYMIPGWYGTGTALAEAIDQDEKNLNLLREAYASWNFFRTVLNNAQLEMARARFAIAQHYSRLTPGGGQGPPLSFHETILRDFEAASGAIVQITGQQEVFDYNPVIRKSIALRNPYTDVLNLLQIELLERHRASTSGDEEQLRRALFLSINGIAAAMQSTG
jgi:phosphoenolpyruvate carboxylase